MIVGFFVIFFGFFIFYCLFRLVEKKNKNFVWWRKKSSNLKFSLNYVRNERPHIKAKGLFR